MYNVIIITLWTKVHRWPLPIVDILFNPLLFPQTFELFGVPVCWLRVPDDGASCSLNQIGMFPYAWREWNVLEHIPDYLIEKLQLLVIISAAIILPSLKLSHSVFDIELPGGCFPSDIKHHYANKIETVMASNSIYISKANIQPNSHLKSLKQWSPRIYRWESRF